MLELPCELLGSRNPRATNYEAKWRRVFKLEDLPWLGAHHIQNETVIPAALLCVMALAAAMDISNGRQADIIELSGVTIGPLIVLKAPSVELETSLRISSLVDSGNPRIDCIQAEFSLNEVATHDQKMATAAKGRLRVTFADRESTDPSILSSTGQPKPCGLIPVNVNQFYDSLSEVGLSYRGAFRAFTSAERRLDYACAVTNTTNEAGGVSGLLHPTRLEACFQTLLLAFAAPRDGSLWTSFTSANIGRLTFFPHSFVGLDTPASVTVEAHLQEYEPGCEAMLPMIKGNIDVSSSETGQLQLRLESLTMSPTISSAEKQDKLMYLKMAWQQDILSGVLLEQNDNTSCHEWLGLSHGHRLILAATRQISHRYRKLKILQIGTSPVHLVQAMCQDMGEAMNSYTIIDTSGRAIAEMRRVTISHDLPIRLEVLDIPKDVGILYESTALSPIDLSSFDLIIALKTSRDESVPLESMRGFLKQGGFLLMTVTVTEAIPPEATDTTCKEIHQMLQRAGFSGVDSLQRKREKGSSFVILSQALDDQVSFLRAPFDRDFQQVEAVLSLTELDYSVLENLSCDTFHGLHQLFDKSKIVLWVTHGARNQNPHQSGTIGLVRAVQAECPEKILQLLNLDEIYGNESLVAESFLRLIGGVRMRDNSLSMLWTVEPELSVQGRRLLIPRILFDKKRNDHLNSLRRTLEAGNPPGLFSPSKTYVLIGLSGQIGQSITRWMVEGGARHVVITSRNPNKHTLWKEELEKRGANIVIKAADVTKKQDMINLRNHILGAMPSIGGVANGAMVQSNCCFSDLTYDALQEVLKPKVDGSVILDEVFSDDDLEFFLLFSSISAVVGQPFQANYDAANNFMNGLAFQRRARNLPASVINCGPIIGLGFIQNIDSSGGSEAAISTLRGLDYMPVCERELHHILAEAILVGRTYETPELITGLETASENFPPFWHKSLIFSHII
ncbi:hypothetical protein N7499_008321 [Penicillium canescens]|nr:hypothetical protein N7499_008321 [Penicillium canescens]KAJ6158652.1 hypothetical protein N7485_011478 [Penicillium canescens]